MAINVHKTRDGEIVSGTVLRALLATGDWEVTGISSVIDGATYWRVANLVAMDHCLVSSEARDGVTSTASVLGDRLQAAIDRSISYDEIVHITVDGHDSGDVLATLHVITDCEIDYAMCDGDGDPRIDVWGFEEDAKDGEMLWRLCVRFEEDE